MFTQLTASDIFTAFGVIFAGLAALLSGYYSRKTITFSQKAETAAKHANKHSEESNVISANAWLDQYFLNVRMWADEGCECISRATHSIDLSENEFKRELYEARFKLSALIDRGRWFFPNQWNTETGVNKEPAYRGYRQVILDHLVDAYDVMRSLRSENKDTSIRALVACQRLFVSEIQEILDPRRREAEIARIDLQFAISEKIRAGKSKELI